MDGYEVFYIDKTLNPFADMLTAAGMECVVDAVFKAAGGICHQTLRDRGVYYELRLNPGLNETHLAQRVFPAWAIRRQKTSLPEEIPAFSYETEHEQFNAYLEARKRGDTGAVPPSRHWNVLRAIKTNPATLTGYNALMQNWYRVAGNPEALRLLFDLFAATPNDICGAIKRWKQLNKAHGWGIKQEATRQQLYNPDSGKGQNWEKSDMLKIKQLENFWLVEWLKAVGFYDVALTRLIGSNKDLKTFVLAPRELTYGDHRAVMDEFVNTMQTAETAARFDILAVIRYLKVLLTYFQGEESRLARLLKSERIKKRVVSGFFTAFYKNMGKAIATMNLAFIALPGWVNVASREDIGMYQSMLNELEMVIRQFDESHSDAFTLLQYLRDFVSGDDLSAFFRFTNAFPTYLMGMRERNKYAYPLSTDFIERLMMSTDRRLSDILQTPGFQNIAYAIRQSTITAQYRKGQGDRKYDVRYGLGQELARKARYPAEFIAALSDFLHKYNAENAQVMETRPGPYRRSIQTTDIDQIVALIDEYDAETVANLLIAYGYARVPREGDAQDDLPAGETEQETE